MSLRMPEGSSDRSRSFFLIMTRQVTSVSAQRLQIPWIPHLAQLIPRDELIYSRVLGVSVENVQSDVAEIEHRTESMSGGQGGAVVVPDSYMVSKIFRQSFTYVRAKSKRKGKKEITPTWHCLKDTIIFIFAKVHLPLLLAISRRFTTFVKHILYSNDYGFFHFSDSPALICKSCYFVGTMIKTAQLYRGPTVILQHNLSHCNLEVIPRLPHTSAIPCHLLSHVILHNQAI